MVPPMQDDNRTLLSTLTSMNMVSERKTIIALYVDDLFVMLEKKFHQNEFLVSSWNLGGQGVSCIGLFVQTRRFSS